MAIPKYVAFKAVYNGKYMRFVNDSTVHGFLKLDGEEAVTPFSIFEIEPAKTEEGMVHIKSIYNNKYFVRQSVTTWWIKGTATEPQEDKSKSTCTLFKLIVDEATQNVLLYHVQLGKYAALWRVDEPLANCLFAGLTEAGPGSVANHKMIDLESLFVLPKRVALKSNNGLFLSPDSSKTERLRFWAENVSDPNTLNVVKITGDGSINVSVASTNKYWKRGSTDFVKGNADEDSLDKDSLFSPLKLEKDIVALKNLGNNLFCKRYTAIGYDSGLSAMAPDTSDVYTKIWVVEPVTVREIYDVDYQHVDSKIYDTKTEILVSESLTNTSEKPQDTEFRYTYENITTGAWNSTVWPKLFSTVHLRADVPTNVANLEDETPPAIDDKSYEWGETKTFTTPHTLSYNAIIPPKTRVTVKLVATLASFDVPFFYSQQDTLATGEQVTYKLKDGVFSGRNYYDFKFETEEKPIP